MDNQATVMDPLFKKIGQTTFTDEDWAALTAAAAKVQATSLKIKDFSKGAEFDALAMKLNGQATELGNSYASKDAVAANTALGEHEGHVQGVPQEVPLSGGSRRCAGRSTSPPITGCRSSRGT